MLSQVYRHVFITRQTSKARTVRRLFLKKSIIISPYPVRALLISREASGQIDDLTLLLLQINVEILKGTD